LPPKSSTQFSDCVVGGFKQRSKPIPQISPPITVDPLPALPDWLSLEADPACLHFQARESMRVLSSALMGGGLGWARHFCNFHVDKGYDCREPVDDLRTWLLARDIPPADTIAMMTAVRLSGLAVIRAEEAEYSVLVAVTAGVGNAVDITAAARDDPRLLPGTINIMAFIDGHPTDAALVNACLSVTEAKTRALLERGVRDTMTGTPATGTSTDCIAIAATLRGKATPYAGSGTRLGRTLGRAVFDATLLSLERADTHTPSGDPKHLPD